MLSALKFAFLISIVMGIDPFQYIGMSTPAIMTWALENKVADRNLMYLGDQVYACLMIFFVTNSIEGQLVSTGAFEVTFNGCCRYLGKECSFRSTGVEQTRQWARASTQRDGADHR